MVTLVMLFPMKSTNNGFVESAPGKKCGDGFEWRRKKIEPNFFDSRWSEGFWLDGIFENLSNIGGWTSVQRLLNGWVRIMFKRAALFRKYIIKAIAVAKKWKMNWEFSLNKLIFLSKWTFYSWLKFKTNKFWGEYPFLAKEANYFSNFWIFWLFL